MFFPKWENYISSVALQRTGTEIIQNLRTNQLLSFCLSFSLTCFMPGTMAVRVHCTLRALLRLKALPHTETPIFQLIVNKCGLFTGVEARATLVLTKDLCSSPQFLLPLFKPLVILITLTLPAECCAFLFSTCQGLEVSHLLFALFSQLNCSFQKRGLSLQAKHCA